MNKIRKKKKEIKSSRSWDFAGSSVVKTPHSHCKGLKLEIKIPHAMPQHGQKKLKSKAVGNENDSFGTDKGEEEAQ